MSYTKGPWKAKCYSNGGFDIEAAKSRFVIAARNGYENWADAEQSRANAALISSAPELVDALEDLVSRCFASNIDTRKARAAIKKAKGEL